jgi:hypothetical protein
MLRDRADFRCTKRSLKGLDPSFYAHRIVSLRSLQTIPGEFPLGKGTQHDGTINLLWAFVQILRGRENRQSLFLFFLFSRTPYDIPLSRYVPGRQQL